MLPPKSQSKIDEEEFHPAQLYKYWHRAFDELKGLATQTCQELKIIGGRLDKLDNIHVATEKLTQQMTGVLQRTTTLEGQTGQNSVDIKALQDEIKGLKSTIKSQEESISDFNRIKEEFLTIKTDFKDTSQDRVREFEKLDSAKTSGWLS